MLLLDLLDGLLGLREELLAATISKLSTDVELDPVSMTLMLQVEQICLMWYWICSWIGTIVDGKSTQIPQSL